MKQSQPVKLSLSNLGTDLAVGVSVFVSRLDMLPGNISPLGSFGFFGSNPLLFTLNIFAFDFLVKGIYPGFWITYIGFAAYPVLGRLTKSKPNAQLIALPLASFLFFLISNAGVWWYWYDHTWIDLVACYTIALPFYTRTLLSDLFFGYGYLVLRKVARDVATQPQPANTSFHH